MRENSNDTNNLNCQKNRQRLLWWEAARPKTLPAAMAPVLIGTAMAIGDSAFHLWSAIAAALGALFIQIGTNYANDYFDYKSGVANEFRSKYDFRNHFLVPEDSFSLLKKVKHPVAIIATYHSDHATLATSIYKENPETSIFI